MLDDTAEADWTKIDKDMAALILQQGERFMSAQLQSAIAADQRATVTGNTFVTVAVAFVAAGTAYYAQKGSLAVFVGLLAVSAVLVAAAAMNFYAARPVAFYLPGNRPSKWWLHMDGNLIAMIGGETENYEKHISSNTNLMNRNGQWQRCGSLTALACPRRRPYRLVSGLSSLVTGSDRPGFTRSLSGVLGR